MLVSPASFFNNFMHLKKLRTRVWLDKRCHELKHIPDSAKAILEEMKRFEQDIGTGKPISWEGSESNQVKGLLQKQIMNVTIHHNSPLRVVCGDE